MAVVTGDFLAALLTNFRALFETDFHAAANQQSWANLAASIPSANTMEQSYNWFGTVPRMEDVTNRQAARQGLQAYTFSLRNKEWQSIVEVERAALERDQLGLIAPRISQMSQEAARHPGELIFELVEGNPTLTWMNSDETSLNLGPYFSNGPRSIGESGDIDNIVTGTGITVAAIQADIATARMTMRLFKDDRGRPMGLTGNIIMVPPQLEFVFYQALNANQASPSPMTGPVLPAGGVTGAAGYVIMVNPYLTDATDWYLFRSAGAVERPFIYQLEKSPELTSDTNPNTQSVIESRKFLYSAYARYNVGVSDPRFAVKVENV